MFGDQCLRPGDVTSADGPQQRYVFTIRLPEQFETRVRATVFAFCTSFGRFVGAGVNFLLGAAVLHTHTLGLPVALTAVVFVIGLFIIPLAPETRGEVLPP
jgi:MFS-type transporter involved in bile tolerance (Atg22 family)